MLADFITLNCMQQFFNNVFRSAFVNIFLLSLYYVNILNYEYLYNNTRLVQTSFGLVIELDGKLENGARGVDIGTTVRSTHGVNRYSKPLVLSTIT